jgi:ATP-dependent RNA helicase RhlE
MSFTDLRLIEPLLKSLRHKGYTTPTQIQRETFQHALAGRDMLGCAQTGTGKTAAFALPILQKLHGQKPRKHTQGKAGRTPEKCAIRALVLSPTRELAAQIGDSFRNYGKHMDLRGTVVFGGVNQRPQVQALKRGVDIVVATPGRLMDLLNQRALNLNSVEILVLDEADRMLDMGFIHDIKKIIGMMPKQRQTLMFSATMPKSIQVFADKILNDPAVVKIAAKTKTAETVKQSAYLIDPRSKGDLLDKLLEGKDMTRTLVFSRTKRGADKITKRLNVSGFTAEAIHSNKTQAARMKALQNFKSGRALVLVASDIAARGLDVNDISHVVNFDMPGDAETYVHRIGRSGRAGVKGQAITFCAYDERRTLRDIEKMIGTQITLLKHSIPSPSPRPSASPTGQRQATSEGGSTHRSKRKPANGAKRNAWQKKSSQGQSNAAPKSGRAKPNRRRARPSKTTKR